MLFIALGVYLVIAGLTAKTLVTWSDIPPTDEQLAHSKATPFRRIVVTAAGCLAIGAGIYQFFR
jgi:hypothetical protein